MESLHNPLCKQLHILPITTKQAIMKKSADRVNATLGVISDASSVMYTATTVRTCCTHDSYTVSNIFVQMPAIFKHFRVFLMLYILSHYFLDVVDGREADFV